MVSRFALLGCILLISEPQACQSYFVSLQALPQQQDAQQQQQQQELQMGQQNRVQTSQQPIHETSDSMSRRSLFGVSSSLFAGGLVLPSHQSIAMSTDADMVIRKFPSIQYLVPIVNFQQALQVLERQLLSSTDSSSSEDPPNFDGAKKALDFVNTFLKGGFLSNKNLFRGMCVVYIGEIQYDRSLVTAEKIAANQNAWLNDCDSILQGVVNMQQPLSNLVAAGSMETKSTSTIMGFLRDSQSAMASFLARIPNSDIQLVQNFVQAVKEADVNRNGKLSKTELSTLSVTNQEIYKIVGDLVLS